MVIVNESFVITFSLSPSDIMWVLRRSTGVVGFMEWRFIKDCFVLVENFLLGYEISTEGSKPAAHKIESIKNYKKPETVQQLRKCLGIINFYRKFLKNAAQQQAILYDLIKGSKKKNDNRKTSWGGLSISIERFLETNWENQKSKEPN